MLCINISLFFYSGIKQTLVPFAPANNDNVSKYLTYIAV